jgi:hypothetical protein
VGRGAILTLIAVFAPAGTPDAAAAPVTLVRGVPFVWPALDSPAYEDRDAAPLARLVAEWQAGGTPENPAVAGLGSAPALYLAADLAYLHAAAADDGWALAADAWERALGEAPDFEDAPRGWFLLGQSRLALGFAPEAGVAFRELARRFPGSGLALEARLGEAAALRLRHRSEDARRALAAVRAEAHGELACRTELEAAAQARIAGLATDEVFAFRRVAETCPALMELPAVRADHGDALAAAGDAAGARVEYERALAAHPSATTATVARMGLVMLEAEAHPGEAADALAALAAEPAPPRLRALVLGQAAELAARAGRFEEALDRIGRAAALGPEGEAQADAKRAELLGRWIATLEARGDAAGIATVYAAQATLLEGGAGATARLAIGRALGGIGLHPVAARMLAGAPTSADPAVVAALAEESFAAGDGEAARRAVDGLRPETLAPTVAGRVHRVRARLALAAGDLEAAGAEAAQVDDLALREDVAAALVASGTGAAASALLQPLLAAREEPPVDALLLAGAAAAAESAWGPAADAFRRALARGAEGPEAAIARAGLARATRARGGAT